MKSLFDRRVTSVAGEDKPIHVAGTKGGVQQRGSSSRLLGTTQIVRRDGGPVAAPGAVDRMFRANVAQVQGPWPGPASAGFRGAGRNRTALLSQIRGPQGALPRDGRARGSVRTRLVSSRPLVGHAQGA